MLIPSPPCCSRSQQPRLAAPAQAVARKEKDSLDAALRAWRQARARQALKQPSAVLSEAVLTAVIASRPLTFQQLLQVRGWRRECVCAPGQDQQQF